MRLILLLLLVTQAASSVPPPSRKAQRLPFQKKEIVFKSPTEYEKRILRYDAKTEEPVYYDPKPQVVLLDEKSGKYAFKWIGYDGQGKVIIFQRADAIDAIVSATVSKTASGQYLYVYKIENLQSSGEQLAGFAVQNFASDVKPIEMASIHIGHMTKFVKDFKEGNWVRFAPLSSFRPIVFPGRSIEFRLESLAPPGLVECRIHGGELGLKGVGEEMPQELANLLPGYKDWPSGYTIGPVEKLKSLSSTERADYILKLLPQFQKLGWMTAGSRQWYEGRLKRHDLSGIYEHVEQDLKTGKITTEMQAMIQAISERATP